MSDQPQAPNQANEQQTKRQDANTNFYYCLATAWGEIPADAEWDYVHQLDRFDWEDASVRDLRDKNRQL